MDTLTTRIYALLSEIVGTALILGLSGEVHTTVHYDTRSGFLSLNVYPLGSNPDQHRNRVTVLITEDQDTDHKLRTLDAYLRNVLRYGYLPFCGFAPLASVPDPLPVTSPSVAGHGQPGDKRLVTRARSGEANPFHKVRPG